MVSIILFTVCVAAILYAGTRLAFYGNLLADFMGWGKMWMGMILMAAVYKSKMKWLMAVDSFLILLVYIFMMKVMFSTGLGH